MKKVLITGASSGIGLQLAQDYLKEGYDVYACGRKSAPFEAIADAHLHPLYFDVRDKEQTQNVLGQLDIEFDLIILNAGVCEYIDDGVIDIDLFKRVFDVNFFGTLHCLCSLQAKMTAKTQLAFMGSIAANLCLPRAEAYGASKAAIAYLAETLQLDLAKKGIAVSLISPGFVKTPLTDKNDFAMPMRVSMQSASAYIRRGLSKKQPHIHFPKRFTCVIKLMGKLPYCMRYPLTQWITRSAS